MFQATKWSRLNTQTQATREIHGVRRDWSSTMCFMRRYVKTNWLSIDGQIYETEFKKWMLAQAGKATSRKRKAVPVVEKEAVHELDSDSDEDDNHGG
jgi:hypothetical protein